MTSHGESAGAVFDGRGLVDTVWRSKWILVAVFLLCGLAAYLLSHLMRPAYRAEALVIPAQSGSSGLLGGIGSLLGASALSNFGLAQDANKNEAIETMRSYALIHDFIVDQNLLPLLCKSGAITCSKVEDDKPLGAERDMNSAIELFQKDLLAVNDDQISGIVHVSLIWYDRRLAADWCNALIDLTNRKVRDKTKELAQRRVGFLRKALAEANLVAVQTAISALLQVELSRELDAGTRPDYAFRIVNAASIPDDRDPVRPRKMVIAAAAGALSSLMALALLAARFRRLGVSAGSLS